MNLSMRMNNLLLSAIDSVNFTKKDKVKKKERKIGCGGMKNGKGWRRVEREELTYCVRSDSVY